MSQYAIPSDVTDHRRAAVTILHGVTDNWEGVIEILREIDEDPGEHKVIAFLYAMIEIFDGTLTAVDGTERRNQIIDGLREVAMDWAGREAEHG